jgi:hypothetical protein
MTMSVAQEDGRKGSWPELRCNFVIDSERQNNGDKLISGIFRTRRGRTRPAPRPLNCPFYSVLEHGSFIAQKACTHRDIP